MQSFAIDGATTAVVTRAQVVEATTQHKAVCLVFFVNGKLQPLIFPFTIKGLISSQQGAAFRGELIQGVATLVHLPDDCFNLASQVQVPTLMSAKILLADKALPRVCKGL